MPYYDYECENGHRFEITRSIQDAPLEECPECKGKVNQVFHPVGVIWRGNFRYMKGSPEVDMDKIEAEEHRANEKSADAKIKQGLKGKNHGKYW